MKKYYLLFFIVCICFLLGCTQEPQDEDFQIFKIHFLSKFWKQHPEKAILAGNTRHATQVTIPDNVYYDSLRAFCKNHLEQLQVFSPNRLTPDHQTDRLMIENVLNKTIWQINSFKSHEWNPAQYNVANILNTILLNTDLSLDERLAIISTRLDSLATYYQTAKITIQQPTRPHTTLAIQQHEGTYHFFNSQLRDSLTNASLSQVDKANLLQKIEEGKLIIKDYLAFLTSWLNNENPNDSTTALRSFRIGKKLFEEKFQYDIISSYDAATIYQKALEQKKVLHQNMIDTSHQLWAKYFPETTKPKNELEMVRQLIDRISENHVRPWEYIKAIRTQISELAAFVKTKNLLDLGNAPRLKVRPTPQHQSGFAVVSITAPGPYNKTVPTYYNVTPLDGLSAKEAKSYLREYNQYVMQLINIREAIPGHYAQLVRSNQSPNLIKSVFGNGTMIEGWAVYAERMMLEEGYKTSSEMWLMHYKMNLRVVINAILDYGIHVLDMSEAEAMNLMLTEGFQEHSEAVGKWQRATRSQTQLCSYFTGGLEVMELRETLKQKQGTAFNLKAFHDTFLSYGSAPIVHIRRLMEKS